MNSSCSNMVVGTSLFCLQPNRMRDRPALCLGKLTPASAFDGGNPYLIGRDFGKEGRHKHETEAKSAQLFVWRERVVETEGNQRAAFCPII